MKIGTILIGIILVSVMAFSEAGASRLEKQARFTLEEMLTYSIEDELLAKAEYEKIIEELDAGRPFTNIVEAEKKHIEYLEPLLIKYSVDYPEIPKNPEIPNTLSEAYRIGVEAEVANIAMYNRFLEEELTDDVREVFIKLRDASKNHLKAFERKVARQR